MNKNLILLHALLAACTAVAPDVNDPTHEVTWTSSLTCAGMPVSHPCPYTTYASLVTFNVIPNNASPGTHDDADRVALTWWGAEDVVGGDSGSVEEVAHQTIVGDIELAEIGDGAGERLAATLTKNDHGYAGDVTWELFTVAGMTTFHLAVDRVDSLQVGR